MFTLPLCFCFKCLGDRIHFATLFEDSLFTEVGTGKGTGERGGPQASGTFRDLFQPVLPLSV